MGSPVFFGQTPDQVEAERKKKAEKKPVAKTPDPVPDLGGLMLKPPTLPGQRAPLPTEPVYAPGVKGVLQRGLFGGMEAVMGATGLWDPLAEDASTATTIGGAIGELLPVGAAMGTLRKVKNVATGTGVATDAARAARTVEKPIQAFHGSPHDFDKFDLSKIGTGEGAQSFGRGLYFAENENVARGYKESLSRSKDATVEGGGRLPDWVAANVDLEHKGGKPQYSIDMMLQEFKTRIGDAEKRVAEQTGQWWNDQSNIPGLKDIVTGLEQAKAGAKVTFPGKTYEVAIHAGPDEFLDWDKPLSEQRETVDAVLRELGITREQAMAEVPKLEQLAIAAERDGVYSPANDAFLAKMRSVDYQIGKLLTDMEKPPNTWGYTPADKTTGMELIRAMGQGHEQALRAAGIKGVRYKDAVSRSTAVPKWHVKSNYYEGEFASKAEADAKAEWARGRGHTGVEVTHRPSTEGTSNYAVFDDQIIEIMKKYGVAFPVAASMFAKQQAQTSKK